MRERTTYERLGGAIAPLGMTGANFAPSARRHAVYPYCTTFGGGVIRREGDAEVKKSKKVYKKRHARWRILWECAIIITPTGNVPAMRAGK